MDSWLTDDIKELLAKPCLETSGMIGRRLDNRRRSGQSIDERALTEDFVDAFDTGSDLAVWPRVISLLRDLDIEVATSVRKSTIENRTGADIGLILSRAAYHNHAQSVAQYAVLIQCKRVDNDGRVDDFYHTVKSTGRSQASLLLDITPASFYFIYVPPSLVEMYCTVEPLAFVQGAPGCSSPVWNMGCFGFQQRAFPFLSAGDKAAVSGILVVPAMAVNAQQSRGASATLGQLLPNAIPLWYWFAELLVPGFIGDSRNDVIEKAANCRTSNNFRAEEFGVRFSIELNISNRQNLR